jgi:hypothetical protein
VSSSGGLAGPGERAFQGVRMEERVTQAAVALVIVAGVPVIVMEGAGE